MLLFGALFMAIVYIFVLFVGGGIFGLLLGLIIVLGYAAFTYFAGDKLVLKMSGAKPADQKQYPTLFSIVEGLALASQLPVPKIYVINDPSPNAFATGKNRKVSAIAVTSGLLSMMDRHELEGVLAHEMSHIYNNDIQFMMVAVVFAGAIGLIAALIRTTLLFGGVGMGGGRSRDNAGLIVIIGLVIGLLAPFIALLIRLAISRRREYMADANGARITRDPASLAHALKKIQAYSASPKTPPMKHVN